MAGVFAKSLKEQLDVDKENLPSESEDKDSYEFNELEVLCAKIAGLCHDLGISTNSCKNNG